MVRQIDVIVITNGANMKNIFLTLASVFLLAVTAQASSASWKLQKIKTVGPLKNEVIFQSRDLRYVKSLQLYKAKVIAQWGVHVFEVGVGFYDCNSVRSGVRYCKLKNYEPKATYERCQVVAAKAYCEKRLKSFASAPSDTDSDYRSTDLVDSLKDEMHRDVPDENAEYPDRDPENVDRVMIGF